MASDGRDVDPITLQVIGGALHTIAREMGHVLYRMSYSSIIRESEDLGAGLFDRRFNTLCESDSTPMHIGSIPAYLRGIEKTLHDPWQPGDIVIHNHPYYGASHSVRHFQRKRGHSPLQFPYLLCRHCQHLQNLYQVVSRQRSDLLHG